MAFDRTPRPCDSRALRSCTMPIAARTMTGFFVTALAILILTAPPASARDGVTGCSIAEVEDDGKRLWRYTIDVTVPKGGHCRVYIGEDKDPKSWKYCWLKRDADNPVSAICDDPIDDKDFDNWKAKAICGGQNLIAYCRRAEPLQPSTMPR